MITEDNIADQPLKDPKIDHYVSRITELQELLAAEEVQLLDYMHNNELVVKA